MSIDSKIRIYKTCIMTYGTEACEDTKTKSMLRMAEMKILRNTEWRDRVRNTDIRERNTRYSKMGKAA